MHVPTCIFWANLTPFSLKGLRDAMWRLKRLLGANGTLICNSTPGPYTCGNAKDPITECPCDGTKSATPPSPPPPTHRAARRPPPSARICSTRFIGAIGGRCIGAIGMGYPGTLFHRRQRGIPMHSYENLPSTPKPVLRLRARQPAPDRVEAFCAATSAAGATTSTWSSWMRSTPVPARAANSRGPGVPQDPLAPP
jgi:hypothetical protein